ncbi:Ku protein [Streptomyces sp. NPDC059740]|uniref:non-homologous end joining protein Ku n=1 Tax=Streptomyces sp. NPDC059740 TaxID=3346926 RepID=UPI0036690288
MRAIWSGAISFGLVTIPVKMYSATDSTASVSFVQIHEKDGGRIRYRKVCELDGEEVPTEEIGKAYPAGRDTVVPITEDDLAALPLPTTKTLTILAFVDAEEIDPLQLGKAYYLGADGKSAAKPYVLLREALVQHRKVAIGKVAMRNRETLAMLRVHEDAIVMHSLLWPDQLRSPEGLAPSGDITVTDRELNLAQVLMDSLGELEPEEMHDDYREAVEELVAAKLEGTEPAAAPATPRGGKVLDLTAALQDSVRAAKESRGETPAKDAEVPEAEGGEGSVTPLRGGRSGGSRTGGTRSGPASKSSAPTRKSTSTSATKKSAKSTAKRSAPRKGAESEGTAKKTAAKKSTSAKSGTSSASKTAKSTSKKAGGGRRAG